MMIDPILCTILDYSKCLSGTERILCTKTLEEDVCVGDEHICATLAKPRMNTWYGTPELTVVDSNLVYLSDGPRGAYSAKEGCKCASD